MSGFNIPLDFTKKSLYNSNFQHDDETSIATFIELLVTSPNGVFKPDAQFGFSLKNCRFENANSEDKIHGKKIGGKSINPNYAKDLNEVIKKFEPRLINTEVNITFSKDNSEVSISISGILEETKKAYKQDIKFHIW